MLVHSLFDVLALLTALAVFWFVPVPAGGMPTEPWRVRRLYIAAGSLGAATGAYLAGSANLWLTRIGGVAGSIEGRLPVRRRTARRLTGGRSTSGVERRGVLR